MSNVAEPLTVFPANETLEEKLARIRKDHVFKWPERLATRREAEDEARHLLDTSAGGMSEGQVQTLTQLFNRDFGGRIVHNRFSPGFTGAHVRAFNANLDRFNECVGRIWRGTEEEALKTTDELFRDKNLLPSAGRSLPTVLLYLRYPQRYTFMFTAMTRGLEALTGFKPSKRKAGVEGYLLFNQQVQTLIADHGLAPQEIDIVLTVAGKQTPKPSPGSPGGDKPWRGLSGGIKFLADLAQNNTRTWFDENRRRYVEELNGPLRDLLQRVADRYIVELDPQLNTKVKTNDVLANIRKRFTDEAGEYQDHYWGAFTRFRKQEDVQLFVNVHTDRLEYGLSLGSAPAHLISLMADAASEQGDLLLKRILSEEPHLVFESSGEIRSVETADALRAWITSENPDLIVKLFLGDDELDSPKLIDSIGMTFRRLYHMAATAWGEQVTEDEPGDVEEPIYSLEDVARATSLPEEDLEAWVELLNHPRKRQAIFYGPPGTGKTFVAQELARHLAAPGGEIAIVQFHPSFSYEDFLEGLRPVTSDGVITYEIQKGVFQRFCDVARLRSEQDHVFIIDELNRAELGAVLGELMMLLEYRELKIELPYSKKPFSVPGNVVLLATMNTADRSLALVDFALRRRFHAFELGPNRDVLAAWLGDRDEAETVLRFYELVQERVADPNFAPGHTYWMIPDVSSEGLNRLWKYELKPYLREFWYERQTLVDDLDSEVEALLAEEV